MKAMQRTTLVLALAGALSMPMLSWAADAAMDEHAGHHPEQAQAAAPAAMAAQDRAKAMRERMMAIRAEKDPAKRKELMEAQMKDMEAMIEQGSCPMMGGMMGPGMGMMAGRGGMGMMGPGMMSPGMMGPCMQGGGMGMSGMDDMMARRMEMMERRMDMMQMMQQRMGPGMRGGVGTSCEDDRMARRMEMMERRMDMMQQGMGMPGGMAMPAR